MKKLYVRYVKFGNQIFPLKIKIYVIKSFFVMKYFSYLTSFLHHKFGACAISLDLSIRLKYVSNLYFTSKIRRKMLHIIAKKSYAFVVVQVIH